MDPWSPVYYVSGGGHALPVIFLLLPPVGSDNYKVTQRFFVSFGYYTDQIQDLTIYIHVCLDRFHDRLLLSMVGDRPSSQQSPIGIQTKGACVRTGVPCLILHQWGRLLRTCDLWWEFQNLLSFCNCGCGSWWCRAAMPICAWMRFDSSRFAFVYLINCLVSFSSGTFTTPNLKTCLTFK